MGKVKKITRAICQHELSRFMAFKPIKVFRSVLSLDWDDLFFWPRNVTWDPEWERIGAPQFMETPNMDSTQHTHPQPAVIHITAYWGSTLTESGWASNCSWYWILCNLKIFCLLKAQKPGMWGRNQAWAMVVKFVRFSFLLQFYLFWAT